VFHIMFGKTVPDVSLNAVANLGYAGCNSCAGVRRRHLDATSEVIGLKENSNRKTGIVYVRTRGTKQDGTAVLEYVRWVMVRKRDESAPRPGRSCAAAADHGRAETLRGRLPADRREGLRLRAGRQSATASAIMKPARRSTMSTASPSRRPSIRSRRGFIRTPRASTSTVSRRRRAASASG